MTYEKYTLKPTSTRYLSLDVLRGMTIALMIVVNNPGNWEAIYAPFEHSKWSGFTPTDLVFPTFLFVMGNALSFSMKKMDEVSTMAFLRKVLKRTILIFAIGLFLNGFPYVHYVDGALASNNLWDIRIWGVLQRIALCYGLASLLIYYFKERTVIIISVVILFLYWAILYYFGTQPDPYSLEHNATTKLDLTYLDAKNMYQGYGIAFDPEGLLGTLPAIVNVIAGFFAGVFIQKSGNNLRTVYRLIAVGLLMILGAQIWDIAFPINKPIWTSSYVLCSVGYDLLIIGALIAVVEVFKVKKWAYFFEAFGKNPLFIYILSWMVISIFYLIHIGGIPLGSLVYENLFASWLESKNASLLFAFSYMLLMWLVGYFMDKRKIYIKV